MYDSDVIVIGGGPAGLSAAIRARRVRTYNLHSSSVMILTNTSPGGLADWTKVRMTGDGWSHERGEIIGKLINDIEDYSIPVKKEKVLGVKNQGDIFTVVTDKGEYKSLAVIVATGMRMTWNEREHFGDKLFGTLKGYRFMEDYFEKLCEKEEGKSIVFVGTDKLDKTLELFQKINQGRMEIKKIIDEGKNIQRYEKKGDRTVIITEQGKVHGDHVLIDFESYQLKAITASLVDCEKDERGFIETDKRCRVDNEGLFAAGDVTGPPFSIAKAVGEGTTAGLESYRYVYSKKFDEEAPVFAFYPIHQDGEATYFEIPALEDHYRPKLLANFKIEDDKLVFRECELDNNDKNLDLLQLCDGKHTLGEIREEFADVDKTIEKLIHAKDLTLEV